MFYHLILLTENTLCTSIPLKLKKFSAIDDMLHVVLFFFLVEVFRHPHDVFTCVWLEDYGCHDTERAIRIPVQCDWHTMNTINFLLNKRSLFPSQMYVHNRVFSPLPMLRSPKLRNFHCFYSILKSIY